MPVCRKTSPAWRRCRPSVKKKRCTGAFKRSISAIAMSCCAASATTRCSFRSSNCSARSRIGLAALVRRRQMAGQCGRGRRAGGVSFSTFSACTSRSAIWRRNTTSCRPPWHPRSGFFSCSITPETIKNPARAQARRKIRRRGRIQKRLAFLPARRAGAQRHFLSRPPR